MGEAIITRRGGGKSVDLSMLTYGEFYKTQTTPASLVTGAKLFSGREMPEYLNISKFYYCIYVYPVLNTPDGYVHNLSWWYPYFSTSSSLSFSNVMLFVVGPGGSGGVSNSLEGSAEGGKSGEVSSINIPYWEYDSTGEMVLAFNRDSTICELYASIDNYILRADKGVNGRSFLSTDPSVYIHGEDSVLSNLLPKHSPVHSTHHDINTYCGLGPGGGAPAYNVNGFQTPPQLGCVLLIAEVSM